jgi:hypothetical protein
MKTITFKNHQINILSALLLGSIACFEVWAQTKPVPADNPPAASLNLDDQNITKELVGKEPVVDPKEKISVSHSQMDDSFAKAEKHGFIPTTKEIYVTGAPQRVTKVTGADGSSYCVYTPTVARTDGIDEIQNGDQTQVRTCPN